MARRPGERFRGIGYPVVVHVTGPERCICIKHTHEIRWYRGIFALYRSKGLFLWEKV